MGQTPIGIGRMRKIDENTEKVKKYKVMNLTISLNKIEELDEAIDISCQISVPSPAEVQKYHNKQDWLKKIKDGGLLLTTKKDGHLAGYAICYREDRTFHIWNVGVLEDFRGMGMWKKMYERILDYAVKSGSDLLTLNTYKSKFSGMYSFCQKNGFVEYKIEDGKSYFIKHIP